MGFGVGIEHPMQVLSLCSLLPSETVDVTIRDKVTSSERWHLPQTTTGKFSLGTFALTYICLLYMLAVCIA